MLKFDVVVVGAGPAGYPCAIRLGQLKKKVLVVEGKFLGGLCLNWGCIPTKALSYAAEMVDHFAKARRMGFNVTYEGYDLDKMRGWKEGVVRRLRSGIEILFKANNVAWQPGMARVSAEHSVEVEHEGKVEKFEADSIVLATGTEVTTLPGLPFDHKHIIDTDDALEIRDIPRRLLVVGAGASGLEMATIYARLGSAVTVVEIMDQILPGMESELCGHLHKTLAKSGIEIRLGSQVAGYELKEGRLAVSIKKGGQVEQGTYDRILVSVGRRPSDRAFKKLGIESDKKGYLVTDRCRRTTLASVYAAGDVAGPPLLAHKATQEGIAVAEIIAGVRQEFDSSSIPSCVFTLPPLASAGLTEAGAAAMGYRIKVGRFPYRASGKAVSMGETEGLVKIIGDEKGRLLGVHILGAESPNLIGEAVLALDQHLSVADIAASVHPHPTLTEMMQEAAEQFHNKAIHIENK